jgi:hypothetical protein
MERCLNTILLFSFFLVISLDPHEDYKRKNMRLFWRMECRLSEHFK